MSKHDDNDYEIVNAKDEKLAKNDKYTSSFFGNIIDKIGELPNFAKEILKSSDKSEENFNGLVKQDKDVIEIIIKQKLESGNYTDEELKEWFDKGQKITENQGLILDKMNKHKKELLLIVAGSLAFTAKHMLENRDKS